MLRKNTSLSPGFTIIELLIVIIIMGILAAVIVVAYNGVQNRAKAAQYLTDAKAIVKKAEVYPTNPNTGGSYVLGSSGPDATTVTSQTLSGAILTAALGAVPEAKLPDNVIIFAVTTGTPTNAQATTAVTANTNARGYFTRYCTTGRGMYVYYPDPTAATTANAPSLTVGTCP